MYQKIFIIKIGKEKIQNRGYFNSLKMGQRLAKPLLLTLVN